MRLFALLVLVACCALAKIVRVNLIHHKSMRQAIVQSGRKISDVWRTQLGGPKADDDSIALSKYLDNEFYGEVKIGQPAQTFRVIFDTAWANAFVPSSQCPVFDIACYFHNKYDSSVSSTYKKNGEKFKVVLRENCSLEGFLSADKINLAHLTIKNYTFAEITSLPRDFILMKADGIFGMAYDSLALGNSTPFFYRLWQDGLIGKPIFSVYFNRDPTTPRGGSLFLGGSDSKHFKGNFTFLPVTKQMYWQIRMDRVEINVRTKNTTTPLCLNGCDVIMDTGSQNIQAPLQDIKILNSLISATKVPRIGSYVVPCNTVSKLPEVSFSFGGKQFMINSDQYIKKMSFSMVTFCVSAFVDTESVGNDNLWVLGGAYMAKYYTEFNMEKNVIGFALANL